MDRTIFDHSVHSAWVYSALIRPVYIVQYLSQDRQIFAVCKLVFVCRGSCRGWVVMFNRAASNKTVAYIQYTEFNTFSVSCNSYLVILSNFMSEFWFHHTSFHLCQINCVQHLEQLLYEGVVVHLLCTVASQRRAPVTKQPWQHNITKLLLQRTGGFYALGILQFVLLDVHVSAACSNEGCCWRFFSTDVPIKSQTELCRLCRMQISLKLLILWSYKGCESLYPDIFSDHLED